MNQILSVDMPKSKAGAYRYKSSKKADIRTIIIFFSIILVLFATIILVVVISMTNKNKKEQVPEQPMVITGTEPTINIEIQSETVLNLIVTHDKQIKSISYNWNDGENIEETDIGEMNKELLINIPAGNNILNVTVTDINGVTTTKSNEYTGTNLPSLVLEQVDDKIKIIAKSDVEIAYISYNWDGGEEKQIEVNNINAEHLIEAIEGEHTLNVVMVDKSGKEVTASQKMKGDNKPTLDITKDANNINLYIKATDDEGLLKLVIENYNNGDIDEYKIEGKEKEYSKTIPLQAGENKLIITVYNINEVKHQKRIRIVK